MIHPRFFTIIGESSIVDADEFNAMLALYIDAIEHVRVEKAEVARLTKLIDEMKQPAPQPSRADVLRAQEREIIDASQLPCRYLDDGKCTILNDDGTATECDNDVENGCYEPKDKPRPAPQPDGCSCGKLFTTSTRGTFTAYDETCPKCKGTGEPSSAAPNAPVNAAAQPALNCALCKHGPRVKGEIVDSCKKFRMADHYFDAHTKLSAENKQLKATKDEALAVLKVTKEQLAELQARHERDTASYESEISEREARLVEMTLAKVTAEQQLAAANARIAELEAIIGWKAKILSITVGTPFTVYTIETPSERLELVPKDEAEARIKELDEKLSETYPESNA